MSKDPSVFGLQLKLAMQNRDISQQQLADELGVNPPLISRWIHGKQTARAEHLIKISKTLGVSIDWLLGINGSIKNYEGIQWIEDIPDNITGSLRKNIETGIQLFHELYVHDHDIEDVLELPDFKSKNVHFLYGAFKTALLANCFRIISVGRREDLENRLREKFRDKLQDIVVANIPDSNDGSLIRSELVAYLAAMNVLNRFQGPSRVGFGHGYTMFRVAQLSTPTLDEFKYAKWIPLTVFPQKKFDFHSANHVALTMAHRHQGSEALYLPFIGDTNSGSLSSDIVQRDEVMREANRADVIFTSVNGAGRVTRRTKEQGRDSVGPQLQTADSLDLGNMSRLYEILVHKRLEDEFAGELLGKMLNHSGNPIPEIEDKTRENFSQVDLQALRSTIYHGGQVWVVAAGGYKAQAVFTVLNNHLANALVIDSDIATELFKF